jgi:hypothetical protein
MTGIAGINAARFNLCSSIAYDSQWNLYVTDYYNARVQKFLRL